MGGNLINRPSVTTLAALSSDALKQDPQTDHSRFSVVLRYTAGGSIDSSVMPNIVRANTDLTCIMIAERLAGWLRAEV